MSKTRTILPDATGVKSTIATTTAGTDMNMRVCVCCLVILSINVN